MFLGVEQEREHVEGLVDGILAAGKGSAVLQAALNDWKDNKEVSDGTRERADALPWPYLVRLSFTWRTQCAGCIRHIKSP